MDRTKKLCKLGLNMVGGNLSVSLKYLCMGLLLGGGFLFAPTPGSTDYGWPFKEETDLQPIIRQTLGAARHKEKEWGHFHTAVDIAPRLRETREVYALLSGKVTAVCLQKDCGPNAFIEIGRLRYSNLEALEEVCVGHEVEAGDLIGHLIPLKHNVTHLHLEDVKDFIGNHNRIKNWMHRNNPLLFMDLLEDTLPPQVHSIEFKINKKEDAENSLPQHDLFGSIDIQAIGFDEIDHQQDLELEPEGKKEQKLMPFKLGFQVKSFAGILLLDAFEQKTAILLDKLFAPKIHTPELVQLIHKGDDVDPRYSVSNFLPEVDCPEDWAWHTAGALGEKPHSRQADRGHANEKVLFPDGPYKIDVCMADTKNNTTCKWESVVVNNFRPFLKTVQVEKVEDATPFYEAHWELVPSKKYELTIEKDEPITTTGTYRLTLGFSEPMGSVLPVSLGKNVPIPMTTINAQGEETLWQGTFTVTEDTSTFSGDLTLHVNGRDWSEYLIAALNSETGFEFPASDLAREKSGEFPKEGGPDTRHELSFDVQIQEPQKEEKVIAAVNSFVAIALRSDNVAGIATTEFNSTINDSAIVVREIDGNELLLGKGHKFQGFRGPPTLAYGSDDVASTVYVANSGGLRFEGQLDVGLQSDVLVDAQGQRDHAVAFGTDNRPRVVYNALNSQFDFEMRLARWDGSQWVKTVIEPPPLNVNLSNMSLAVDPLTGVTYAGYLSQSSIGDQSRKFIVVKLSADGQILDRRVVETSTMDDVPGQISDLIVDNSGNLHVTYTFEEFQTGFFQLKYFNGVDTYEVIEADFFPADTQANVSIALDVNQNPYVAYTVIDPVTFDTRLKVAKRMGSSWVETNSLSATTTVFDVDMAIGTDNAIQLVYAKNNPDEVIWVKKTIPPLSVNSNDPTVAQLIGEKEDMEVEVIQLDAEPKRGLRRQRLKLLGKPVRVGERGKSFKKKRKLLIHTPEIQDGEKTDKIKIFRFEEKEWKPVAKQWKHSSGKTFEASISKPGVFAALAPNETPSPQEESLEKTFKEGEMYSYPNPAVKGKNPTIHVEAGVGDGVLLYFYDRTGQLVFNTEVTDPPQTVQKGAEKLYAYRYTWDVSQISSGLYFCAVKAHKNGQGHFKQKIRVAVIK